MLLTNQGYGAGTGTIVSIEEDGRGLVLTCAHLFLGRIGGTVDLRYADGTTTSARLLDLDRGDDLAALEIQGAADRRALPVADSWPGPGTPVIQYGYPGEAGGRMNRRAGRIREYAKSHLPGLAQLTLDMRVAPGDSGSAVIAGGKLVGVVRAKPVDAAPLAYCTGLDEVRRFLDRFRGRFFRRGTPPPARPTDPPPTMPREDPPRAETPPGGLLPGMRDRLGEIRDRLQALEAGARLLPEVAQGLHRLDAAGRKLDHLGEGLQRLQALEKLQDLAKLKDLAGGAAAIEGRLAWLPWIVGGTATGGSLVAGLLGFLAVRRGLGTLAGGIHGLAMHLHRAQTQQTAAPPPPPSPAAAGPPAAPPPQAAAQLPPTDPPTWPTPTAPPPSGGPRYVAVPAPTSRLQALEAALDYYARRYPGHLDFVQTIQAYADQYESGGQGRK